MRFAFQYTMTRKIKRFRMSCGRKLAGSSLTPILTTKVWLDSSWTVSTNLFKCPFKVLSPNHPQSSYRLKLNTLPEKLKIL